MTKKDKARYKKYIYYTGISLLLIIVVMVFMNFIIKNKTFSENENRTLQERPAVSWQRITSGRFQEEYQNFTNDQFAFRDVWIKVKAGVDVLTGKTYSNGVYYGKKGYLFEEFVEPDADNYAETVAAINKFAGEHPDLKQYMMLVPNALNTYENYLPMNAPVEDQNVSMEQFYTDIASSGIQNIDLRDTFKENRDNTQLYYKTDHHWTTDAAYLAFEQFGSYAEIAVSIDNYDVLPVSESFNGTLSAKSGFRQGEDDEIKMYFPKDENEEKYVVNYVEEKEKAASLYETANLDVKDKYAVFLNGNHAQIKITSPVTENRRLLILKDSYANCFIPFLANYYREIVVVDPRYYYDNLQDIIDVEEITEVLYLYNANTFFQDRNLKLALSN